MLGQDTNTPRTPIRGDRTPHSQQQQQRTPNRNNNRTPLSTTPNRINNHSRTIFKTPVRAPDFVALAREQQQPQFRHESLGHNSFFAYNPDREPIKAYLRIRPQSAHYEPDSTTPYLDIVDDLEISMTPPEDSNAYRTRNRAPERYKFSKIFTDSVSQQDFFNKTTLPLIHDVLHGENALIFAYGVTNSGKTFSIMGTKKNPGLLPRTLDVIFNSVHDFISETKVKPCMHSLVQTYFDPAEENRDVLEQIVHMPASSSIDDLDVWDNFQLPTNRDNTTLAIEENYEYGIWVSFAEIYTEKIYDLLERPDRLSKRKSLPLKYEYSSGHKYISGLKEVKVNSIQEAYAILFEGQKNRAEYSTITNHTSSRSHSIFTIRIVKVPIDDNNYIIEDPIYATVSKFSIVDLAGSERYRNTLNSGQRLKEAGNINKSLMVLGQCMETLRLNQLKSAIGKKNAMVPYRHSKLTELFKSSFEGDGKAVMVVNVNPFDTGFDENSHVMKFSAVAKDVATWRRVHPKLELRDISTFVNKRLRSNSKDKRIYHGIQELMEEEKEEEEHKEGGEPDENSREEDEDDEEDNEDPFVDNLIAQLDDLRNKLIESETRNATQEAEIRCKLTQEFELELKKMEDIHMTSLTRENEFTDAQIKQRLNITDKGESYDDLLRLQEKQNSLSSEMKTMKARLDDHEAARHNLLEKIAELEKDKQKQQETLTQLRLMIKERDATIETLKSEVPAPAPPTQLDNTNTTTEDTAMELDNPFVAPTTIPQHPEKKVAQAEAGTQQRTQAAGKSATFEKFLELRKKLRRSIFRDDEYSHDADVIMSEIEQFKGVSFDLVKETNMGKLMKLITQREFKNDPYNIKNRSKTLFKNYAKLSIPVLAPAKKCPPRESMIVLSVNAGREEELIFEMRTALSTLQEENNKLKQKVKLMHEGHRRLKEAFEKTRVVEDSLVESRTTTLPQFPSLSSLTDLPTTSTSSSKAAQPSALKENREKEEYNPFVEEGNQEGEEKQDDLEMEEMFSPILGAAAPGQSFSYIHQAIGLVEEEEDEEEEGDRSTLVEQGRNYQVEEEGEELYPPQPMRTKKRRRTIENQSSL